MKAHKLLKHDFPSEIIPAPPVLSETGCQIALKIADPSQKVLILDSLKNNMLKIKKAVEADLEDL
jgi:hypothetical protein